MTLVKICGLNTPEALDAALAAGADFVGAVSFPKSPRHLDMLTAAALFERARGRAGIVAVTVDADDHLLTEIGLLLRPDLIQLHGSESPERVLQAKRLTRAGAVKALPVRTSADLAAAREFEPVADWLMFDAKPPESSDLPGGVGHAFDWQVMAGYVSSLPWFLAGGLSAENIAEAVRITRAPGLDVSSGVESAPGVKDPSRIAAFLKAARSA
jgi:phosphoribosylanthranilate isomerase